MEIISWNVRGLGGAEKRKEVHKLVGEKNPFIVCLQKKNYKAVMTLCSSLWGNSPHRFSYRPLVGASGG
jgi:hypothetical protein